jgi:hypothetical protein
MKQSMKKKYLSLLLIGLPLNLRASYSPNCRLIQKQTEAHQPPLFSPKIFSKITREPNWLIGPIDMGEQTSYRLGIELDLLQWVTRGDAHAYATSECEHIDVENKFEKALVDIPLALEKSALTAEDNWLKEKQAEIKSEISQFQRKWQARVVSLPEFWQRKKWLMFIELKQHEIKQNLKQLPQDINWMTEAQLKELEGSLTEHTIKTAMAKEKYQTPQPWNLSLQAGQEKKVLTYEGRIDTPSHPRPYFASLELSYLLFAPNSMGSRVSELEAAYRDDLDTNVKNPHAKLLALREKIQQERENKNGRLLILKEYLQEINQALASLDSHSQGVHLFSFQLQQEKFGNEMEAIYLADKIEKMDAFFGVKAKEKNKGSSLISANMKPAQNPVHLQVIATLGLLRNMPTGGYATASSKMRAKIEPFSDTHLAVRFVYQGPTEKHEKLSSGIMREQFGFFIRALNQCNGVYIMLRLGAQTELVVQSKLNPGKSTHAECEANGYKTIRPDVYFPLPHTIKSGDSFVLKTQVNEGLLEVFFDKTLLWKGQIPDKEFPNPGYAGLRSDNAKIDFDIVKDNVTNGT